MGKFVYLTEQEISFMREKLLLQKNQAQINLETARKKEQGEGNDEIHDFKREKREYEKMLEDFEKKLSS